MLAVERVCAFSSGESTANGRLANPCTAALCARELPVTFFGCTTCVPSKTVWRCSHCWKLAMDHLHCLVSANKQREAVPEVMRHPDVKNFFDYDFGDLSVPPPWCQSVPHISQDTFYLHDGCPCCYQVNLPPAPPPTFYYGSVLPSIQSVERQILQMPVLRFHGKFEVMPLVVEIVKVNPVLTTDQELEYQYCSLSFDSTANKNIVTYMHSPAQHVDIIFTQMEAVIKDSNATMIMEEDHNTRDGDTTTDSDATVPFSDDTSIDENQILIEWIYMEWKVFFSSVEGLLDKFPNETEKIHEENQILKYENCRL